MRADVKLHVLNCIDCQKFNTSQKVFHPLRPQLADQPMDYLCVDLIGPFKRSLRGNTFLLVVVDVFTKFVWLKPLLTKDRYDVAQALFDIFCLFGFPKILQSDNGTEFVNQILQAMQQIAGILQRLILAYNPGQMVELKLTCAWQKTSS